MYVLPLHTQISLSSIYMLIPYFSLWLFHSKEGMFSLFLYKLIVSFTRTKPTIPSSTNEPTVLRTSLKSTGAQQIAGK